MKVRYQPRKVYLSRLFVILNGEDLDNEYP